MNWKLWGSRSAFDQALEALRAGMLEDQKKIERLERAVEAKEETVERYHSLFRTEQEKNRAVNDLLRALRETEMLPEEQRQVIGMAEPTDRLWLALQLVLAGVLSDATSAALLPGLNDADRHFNGGRAAGVSDLIALLESIRIEVRRENEEEKN